MRFWKIILLIAVLLVSVCSAEHYAMHRESRPMRPSEFKNEEELKLYIDKLKTYINKNGIKYGKRFSPIQYEENAVEMPYNVAANDYNDDY